MERSAMISHNSSRAIGFNKSMSPSSPYGSAPQGSQRITLNILSKCQVSSPYGLGVKVF